MTSLQTSVLSFVEGEIIHPPLRVFCKLEEELSILEKCLYVCFGLPPPSPHSNAGEEVKGFREAVGEGSVIYFLCLHSSLLADSKAHVSSVGSSYSLSGKKSLGGRK